MRLDFTSALYLGMRHESRALRPWAQLTGGVPAALAEPPAARRLAAALADLQGCERATLAPSTLHLFWDLFGVLAGTTSAIYVDAGVYPVARWGIERAAARGVPVRGFRHHDPDSLLRLLRAETRARGRPVVVADGFCPACGRPAPLPAYLRAARERGGRLVVDDTQAAGIFGNSPDSRAPYGRGGGGIMRWHDLKDTRALVVSSLAKGFGVPVAALAGGEAEVARFESESRTRVHCSPPSAATLAALERALRVNLEHGDALRLRLARLVCHFRRRLAAAGFKAAGLLFPVQTLAPRRGLDPARLHEQLLTLGIQTVLHRTRLAAPPRLSFVVTARHTVADLDAAAAALSALARAKAEARTPEATHEL